MREAKLRGPPATWENSATMRPGRRGLCRLLAIAMMMAATRHDGLAGGPSQTQVPPARFKSGVELVTVPVVVTDGADRPVGGLGRNDFAISQDGRLQTISRFEVVSIRADRTGPADSTPFSDVADNGHPSRASRQLVLVIDDLHIVESDIVAVKRVATALVDRLAPDDSVAVVYVGRSGLGQDFTRDRARATAALTRAREAFGFGLDAGPPPKYAVSYSRSTLTVLENVLKSLASSTSPRRAAIYIGNGFDTAPAQDFRLQAIFARARREDIPIHTIDPRGLVLVEDAIRGGIGALDSSGAAAVVRGRIKGQQELLRTIAVNTGGRAFVNRSNPVAAADEILGEMGNYYLLGFYPDPYIPDGQFHKIEVSVTRAGMRVRSRDGYLAPSPDPAPSNVHTRVEQAIAAGAPVGDLPLEVVATPLASKGNATLTLVTARVGSVDTPPATDTLVLSIRALDAEGRIRAAHDRDFAARRKAADQTGFSVHDAIRLPRTAVTLRVAVGSTALAKAGSVHVTLPALAGREDRVWMSGIFLGIAGERVDDALSGVPAGLVPFTPTTTRTWDSADTLRLFVRLSWLRKDRVGSAVVSIRGREATIAEPVPIEPVSERTDREEGFIDVARPLKDLSAGDYVLTVSARSERGEDVSRSVPFRVRRWQ